MATFKTKQPSRPHALPGILTLIFLVFFTTRLRAQVYIEPANHADQTLTSATSVNTINCDLIDECPGVANYGVIAWDDNAGSGVRAYFDVLYNGTSIMGPIALPVGSEKPDVVIGTPSYATYSVYRVAIFYQLGTDVYLDYWNVDISQTPPNKITHVSGAPWKLNANTAGSPHIDVLLDFANPFPSCTTGYTDWPIPDPVSISVPSAHHYVLAWHEYNTTAGVYEVRSLYGGDISLAPTSMSSFLFRTIASPGKFPDVATSWQYTPPGSAISPGYDDHAYYTYTTDNVTSGQDLWVTRLRRPSFTLSTVSLETGKDIYAPRIEAQGMMDATLGSFFHFWKVGASVGPAGGGGTINGKIYNPAGSSQIYPGYGSDIRVPVVAAGSGMLSPTSSYSVFNQYYPFAFYAPYDDHYHMGAAVYNSLLLNTIWELNMSTISLSSPDPYAVGIAATNNTGMNLLAAWFDGSDIQYKISDPGNLYTTMWKPTSIVNIETGDADIYPNPAKEKLMVKGIRQIMTYSIFDISGRALLSGELSKTNNAIETTVLPQGVYIIKFIHDGIIEQRKFLKE